MKAGIIIICLIAVLAACKQKQESPIPEKLVLTVPKEDSAGADNYVPCHVDLTGIKKQVMIGDKSYEYTDTSRLKALLKENRAVIEQNNLLILRNDSTPNVKIVEALDMAIAANITKYAIVYKGRRE